MVWGFLRGLCRALGRVVEKSPSVVSALLIFIVSFAVFAPSIGFPFVEFDDLIHIPKNPHIYKSLGASLSFFWLHSYEGLYIPFAYTVWRIIAWFAWTGVGSFGVESFNASVFHGLNCVVHSINAMLVFLLLKRFVESHAAALCGALLFALHPVQVESVAWIAEFRGLLAWMLTFLGMLSALYSEKKYRSSSLSKASPSRLSISFAVVSATLFLLSLLSKPATIIAPLLLLGLGYLENPRAIRRYGAIACVWGLVAIPVFIATTAAQPASYCSYDVPWYFRGVLVLDTIGFYVRQILLPLGLSPDYGRTPEWLFTTAHDFVTPLIAVGIGVLIALRFRRARIVVPSLMFVVSFLPVSGIVTFAFQNISGVADRYLYGGMFAVGLMVSFAVEHFRGLQRNVLPAGLIAAAVFATELQLPVWSNDTALFSRIVNNNPTSFIGLTYFGRRAFAAGDIETACELLEKADGRQHNESTAYWLSKVYLRQNKNEKAVELLRQLEVVTPDDPIVHQTYAEALCRVGNDSLAREHFFKGFRKPVPDLIKDSLFDLFVNDIRRMPKETIPLGSKQP